MALAPLGPAQTLLCPWRELMLGGELQREAFVARGVPVAADPARQSAAVGADAPAVLRPRWTTVYTLDGTVLTADTSAIAMTPDGSLAVTFAGASADGVAVSVASNAARVGTAVAALVRSYNAARRCLDSHVERFPLTTAALKALGWRFRTSLASVATGPAGRISGDRSPALLDTVG